MIIADLGLSKPDSTLAYSLRKHITPLQYQHNTNTTPPHLESIFHVWRIAFTKYLQIWLSVSCRVYFSVLVTVALRVFTFHVPKGVVKV